MVKALLVIIASGALAALCVALAALHSASSDMSRVQTSLSAQSRTERSQAREISALQNTVATLASPTDPLSAYNDICNQQLQNGTTGVTQTYYYPCTNNAQTIPQPGN